MDETDKAIVSILQGDARATTVEIGRRLNLAQSAVHQRIRKLQEQGAIEAFEATLSPAAMGLNLVAFVLVRTPDHTTAVRVGERLAEIDEIQEVHHIAGEDCLLIKVRARDNHDLWELFSKELNRIKGITSKTTTIVLETVKDTRRLPLRARAERTSNRRSAGGRGNRTT